MTKLKFIIIALFLLSFSNEAIEASAVGSKKSRNFIFVTLNSQNENFSILDTHKFQKIIKTRETLSNGSSIPERKDSTGYLITKGETTSITFTTDFNFLFTSIQHTKVNNTISVITNANNNVVFNKCTSIGFA